MQLYSVYFWDSSAELWHLHRRAVRLWTLRRVIRALRGRGFCSVSVLVERNE